MLLRPIRRHPREAPLIRLVHLWDFKPILPQLLHQLRRVKFAITPARLDHLTLLLEREILPRKARPDVLLKERQDFVVTDGARVGEVVDAGFVVGGEQERAREEVVEDGVGVGDVDYIGVGGNFGDEGARVEVIGDGHAEAEDEGVSIVLQELFGL